MCTWTYSSVINRFSLNTLVLLGSDILQKAFILIFKKKLSAPTEPKEI